MHSSYATEWMAYICTTTLYWNNDATVILGEHDSDTTVLLDISTIACTGKTSIKRWTKQVLTPLLYDNRAGTPKKMHWLSAGDNSTRNIFLYFIRPQTGAWFKPTCHKEHIPSKKSHLQLIGFHYIMITILTRMILSFH